MAAPVRSSLGTTSRAARRAATAERILRAAQEEFGEHGVEAATVRSIARRAGVDPSLVLQHYGSKRELFALAIRPTSEVGDDVPGHLLDVLATRLDGLPPETRALVRSMLTAPEAGDAMRAYLAQRADRLAAADGSDDAQLRAALAVSSILGVTIGRHFLELDGLSDVTEEQLDRVVRPWLASLDGGAG